MADPAGFPPIGGHYLVDAARPLPEAGGGLPAFAASDRRGTNRATLMALRVARHAPVRARALQTLTSGIDNLLTPLAHGLGPSPDNEAAYYVVCPLPPGQPLSASLRPWPEAVLIEQVLRPFAAVLEELRDPGRARVGVRAAAHRRERGRVRR